MRGHVLSGRVLYKLQPSRLNMWHRTVLSVSITAASRTAAASAAASEAKRCLVISTDVDMSLILDDHFHLAFPKEAAGSEYQQLTLVLL